MAYIQTRGKALAVLAGLLAWASPGHGAPQETRVTQGQIPDWVEGRAWDRGVLQNEAAPEEGIHHLLIDRQEHPARNESYLHRVVRLLNEQGVQDYGNLLIDFDPSHQELILHQVQLHRDGVELDRLDLPSVKVLQPERELAWHIYTGEQSAALFLADLRVGDVLEFAYTLRGGHPVMAGHFWTRLYLEGERPVHEQYYRVVWPPDRPWQERHSHQPRPPRVVTRAPWKEYSWHLGPLPGVTVEDNLPPDFEPFAYIELSDFPSWAEVVTWALPLYPQVTRPREGEMGRLIAQWEADASDPEERARAAVRFVQNDLRYLGLEWGPHSHEPAAPALTLERRFGDCKDKTYLLCTLLRAMNLEAHPALVNSYECNAVAGHLPSPFAFDHVIVKLQQGDTTYWVDPTQSHQAGLLRYESIAPYGQALVIRAGNRDLEPIPTRYTAENWISVSEDFLIADYDQPVQFTVETDYHGSEANQIRATLADKDRGALSQEYLNFYSRLYPGIHNPQPLRITDDTNANVLNIVEAYTITNLWTLEEAQAQWSATFIPHNLQSVLPDPEVRLRKMPLHIPQPLRRSHQIRVRLPEPWDLERANAEVRHEAFEAKFSRECRGPVVAFEYELKTLSTSVAAEAVTGYLETLEEFNALLGDVLYRPSGNPFALLGKVNWMMVVITVCYSLVVALGMVWIARSPRFRPPAHQPPPLPAHPRLHGLGGWLRLLGLGVILAPLNSLYFMGGSLSSAFSHAVWQEVAMPQGDRYHPVLGPLLIGEWMANLTVLGLEFLLIYLFFARRRLFARLYLFTTAFYLGLLLADTTLAWQIPAVTRASDPPLPPALAGVLFRGLVWCPYLLLSKRVKATFIR